MKVCLDATLFDSKKRQLTLDPTSVQLGDFLYHAVATDTTGHDVATKRLQTALMNKVSCGGVVEITSEECNKLLDYCAKAFPVMHFAAIELALVGEK
jgi:hypothetical protein